MFDVGDVIKNGSSDYFLKELIGRGANTAAWLAEKTEEGLKSRCVLKEYAPQDGQKDADCRERCVKAAHVQNDIRRVPGLMNRTPPVYRIFEAEGTVCCEVVCYGGTTLDRLAGLDLPRCIRICEAIARTAEYYHKAGYWCLDIKPENIFVLMDSAEDVVTQLVEFIDFDAMGAGHGGRYYTRDWAAPELRGAASAQAGPASDIYTLGEMAFYGLFGRHSRQEEHRGFSEYPFSECAGESGRYAVRPDIQSLFTRFFRGTIRTSAYNRFEDMAQVASLLGRIASAMEREDYVIPAMPRVTQGFVGRAAELSCMEKLLKKDNVLFVTGVGGIGKSELVKEYINTRRNDYDVIIYLEYEGSITETFADDTQLKISTLSRTEGESAQRYFAKKLALLKAVCAQCRVLMVIDGFSGRITRDVTRLMECGFDTVLCARRVPPDNSFSAMELGPLENDQELLGLAAAEFGGHLNASQREAFLKIAECVQGHTLVMSLIAKQIASGRMDANEALAAIREKGFMNFSGEKVVLMKGGEEIYDSLASIISSLFDAGGMDDHAKRTLKTIALFSDRGLETGLAYDFFPELDTQTVNALAAGGWLRVDDRIRMHTVTAQAVRGWEWPENVTGVMEIYREAADVYSGFNDRHHMRVLLGEARRYCNARAGHFERAMYSDMLGSYYDLLLGGAYVPENAREERLLNKLIDSSWRAVEEFERSDHPEKHRYVVKSRLGLANVLIRCAPGHRAGVQELLKRLKRDMESEPDVSENRCYYHSVLGWYYTLVKPDAAKTKSCFMRAERIAKEVFVTKLEIIDVVHIPLANCLFYHGDLDGAAGKLAQAEAVCRKCGESTEYISKRAELMGYRLGICYEAGDMDACRRIILEADEMKEKYEKEGISVVIPDEIRAEVQIISDQTASPLS